MAPHPLSHHDVLPLVAPFGHAGFVLDLASSRREERRLVFRPAAEPGAGAPAVTFELDVQAQGRFELVRRLSLQAPLAAQGRGVQATVRARGSDLAGLIAALQSLPTDRHAVHGDGWIVTRDFVFDAWQGAPVATGAARLVRASAHVPGLELTMEVPPGRGVAARLALRAVPEGAPRPALPEDVLAVLGWNWARLVPDALGWTTRMRLGWPFSASSTAREARAEAAIERAAAHLARTLAESPAAYHARHAAARWGVFVRRGIPTFTALALVAVVLLGAYFDFDPTPLQSALLYHVPTLLVALSFVAQELARFEIPPLPRRLRAEAWRVALT